MLFKLILICVFYFNNLFCVDVTYSANTTLSVDIRLNLTRRAIFNNTLTLDGAGYDFQFPITSDATLIVNNGFTATITNLLLNHFRNSNLSLGTGSNIIFGNNSVLNCILDQTLTNTLKFSGTSTLLGNYTTIDLGTGKIEVQSSGNLTIENVSLTNVTSLNLRCVDNSASIKFTNVILSIPDRWTFGNGSFSVSQNLELQNGVFAYTSAYTSTVLGSSNLIFSNNLSFSYDPAILSSETAARRTNLIFTNTSSVLVLDSANLYITTTGIDLFKGSLSVIGKNQLFSDATSTNNGKSLSFGNENFTDDFVVKRFNSATSSIDIKKGFLNYKNGETKNLKFGDGLLLKNKKYGFYLYTSSFDWTQTGRVLGGSSSISDKTIWIVANDSLATPWSDVGQNMLSYANFSTSPSDSYILLNKNYANIDYLGICSTASGAASSRVSSGAHTLAFTENVNTETTRRTVSFLKATHPVAKQTSGGQAYNAVSAPLDEFLNEGNEICIMSNGSGGRGMWLTGTNQTFVENAETINEVSWYKGTGGDGASLISGTPSDGSHIWIVEQVSSANYASLAATLIPPVPLKYGDGFALKHKNYGFYASNGALYSAAFGITSTLNNSSQFIIMPLNCDTSGDIKRWGDGSGGNLVTTNVKSGDNITLVDYSGLGYALARRNTAPPTSTPTPPYFGLLTWTTGQYCYRIFAKNKTFGAVIYTGDDIYLIDSWNYWTNVPSFLGSSNIAFGANKEIYWYDVAAPGTPPLFTTNFLWNMSQYSSFAYLSISNYIPNSTIATTGYSANWSPYLVPGGAYYVDPATLQF